MSQVKIIPFNPGHLSFLEIQKEQQIFFTLAEDAYGELPAYGQHLLDHAAMTDKGVKCAWTAWDVTGNKNVGSGGILQVTPYIAEAWLLLSPDFKKHAKSIIPKIRQEIKDTNVRRVQAFADTDFPRAQFFLKALGFETEGLLRKNSVDGKDQFIYSIVR